MNAISLSLTKGQVWLRLLALVALIGAFTAIVLALDIHADRALDQGGVERYPGANQVGIIASLVTVVGMLAVIVGSLLGILYSLRHHWWLWVGVALGVGVLALYANLNVGFTADPLWAFLTLTAPLGLVLISLQRTGEKAM